MATAAAVTVAEVEEVVPTGALDPETVVTPSIYVDRVVVAHRPMVGGAVVGGAVVGGTGVEAP